MTGLTNYTADNLLNWVTGQVAEPVLPSVYLALFTAVGSDTGGGFTEVSGGAYARVQIAGNVATNNTTSSSSAVLNFASVPSWVTQGMYIYNVTHPSTISAATTVSSIGVGTVTMSANAAGAGVSNGDTIVFSAFSAPTGTAPSQATNNAVITFPQATANWGTVIAFGLYDASSSGNLLIWDFMGNYSWLPASVTGASPAVFSTHAHGYSNGDPLVATAEYGGTLPTVTAGGPLTSYTVNYALSVATDTFELNTASGGGGTTLNASTSGDLMVRKITQQIIPQNVTASFAASTFTVSVS